MNSRQGMLHGQCLCGEVRYEASGAGGAMWYCHCRACRKSSGVGFATWIEAPGIRWLAGEQQVTRFSASPALVRAFCERCGSVLPALAAHGGSALLPAGGLEDTGARQPCCHAHASERVAWLPVWNDALPQYPGPRGQGDPIDPQSEDALPDARLSPATVPGSCLCGAVGWAVEPPLFAMRVCHCSRCRRRSGSSYFVGLACGASSLHWRSGEQLVRSWQMPGTRFYKVFFCTVCGAAVPSATAHGTFLSAGTLDDDPGIRASCHIYYGSRAPWISTADGMVRFDEFTPPDFAWKRVDADQAADGAG
ncbi:MAG: GFA family protein [Pseudomonadales bacterium]